MQYEDDIRSRRSKHLTVMKAVHPKLMNILMQTKTPSPYRVVSDAFQPITGDLNEKKIENVPLPYSKPKEICKKDVVLDLKMNSMLGRRPKKF
jgi:hypothetical protein